MRPTAARIHQRRPWLPVLLLAGLAVAGAPRDAGAAISEGAGSARLEHPRTWQVRHAQLTLDQAIAMAEQRFRARVVRAAVEDANGQRIYVLRLVSDQGRVWTVRVDAQSGSII